MKCEFQVGDEIACVETATAPSGYEWDPRAPMPEVGKVYHVDQIVPVPAYRVPAPGWELGIALAEIPGVASFTYGERFRFPHIWFRKVEKPKHQTDIEVFREIDREVFEKTPVAA